MLGEHLPHLHPKAVLLRGWGAGPWGGVRPTMGGGREEPFAGLKGRQVGGVKPSPKQRSGGLEVRF